MRGQSWAFEIRISQGSGQRARRLRRRRPGGSRGNREWRTWRTVESTSAHEVLCACVQLEATVVVRGSGAQRVRREQRVDVGWRNGELTPEYRYDSIGRYHPHPQRPIARDQEQQANTDCRVRRNLAEIPPQSAHLVCPLRPTARSLSPLHTGGTLKSRTWALRSPRLDVSAPAMREARRHARTVTQVSGEWGKGTAGGDAVNRIWSDPSFVQGCPRSAQAFFRARVSVRI